MDNKLDLDIVNKLRKFKNQDVAQLMPKVNCRKCRGRKWFQDTEPLSWKCAYCGNTAFYLYGTLKQQIDVLLADEGRGQDFIPALDGKSIGAKRSEEVKMLKFKEAYLRK